MLQSPFEMCFVDDRNYNSMRRSKVYYIQPPPYFHSLSESEINNRFTAFLSEAAAPSSLREIAGQSKQQNITNKIMYYLREYFLMTLLRSGRSRTKKRRNRVGTRKRYL
jgi:hypothetical protein